MSFRRRTLDFFKAITDHLDHDLNTLSPIHLLVPIMSNNVISLEVDERQKTKGVKTKVWEIIRLHTKGKVGSGSVWRENDSNLNAR